MQIVPVCVNDVTDLCVGSYHRDTDGQDSARTQAMDHVAVLETSAPVSEGMLISVQI